MWGKTTLTKHTDDKCALESQLKDYTCMVIHCMAMQLATIPSFACASKVCGG